MKYLSQISFAFYNFQNTKLTMRSIWIALKKQNDLNGLVQWAARKRLTTVRQAYQRQLHEIEIRLWQHQVRRPRLLIFCEFLFTAYQQIMAPSKYKRGSAVKYRLSI
jgi:hypothetical protein